MVNDTIAAVSTPYGSGGIGIVRISGYKAFEIAAKIFTGRRAFDKIKSHTINYGRIVDPVSGGTIDEVLLTKMSGPDTFTREDVVEINCHGGLVVLKNVLDLVLREGARAAEPGEFTKRAFLNGRIDLSQAEAVIDIINSKTSEGSHAAVEQLEGRLSERVKNARNSLIEIIARIEVTVDYPELDMEEETGSRANDEIRTVKSELEKTAKTFERGKILREGITIVIAGKPNAGKSSLMNYLAGSSRAIVTPVPGTTRDIIEEYINMGGIPVRLVDTAGIRHTDDPVESLGVEKAEKSLNTAGLIIMMLDASSGIDPLDEEIIRKVSGKKTIFMINKTDIAKDEAVTAIENALPGTDPIRASMIDGTGVNELEKRVEGMFLSGGIDTGTEVLVTNARHKNLLDRAIDSLSNAERSYESGMPIDIITIDIKNAAESLGRITGESVGEDVVREIFSRFCVGK